jgi:predicted metalloenzyme YecM
MDTIVDVIGDYKKFLDDVYANINGLGINVSDFPIDHIAYRTKTKERYEAIRNELNNFGTILSEIIIRERPVAIFKLNDPLDYKEMKISFFEILAPAQGDTFYVEGLEHAEFVVNIPLSEMINQYPSIDFILNDNEINPELILRFPIQANAKFHEKPIDEVIKLQEAKL